MQTFARELKPGHWGLSDESATRNVALTARLAGPSGHGSCAHRGGEDQRSRRADPHKHEKAEHSGLGPIETVVRLSYLTEARRTPPYLWTKGAELAAFVVLVSLLLGCGTTNAPSSGTTSRAGFREAVNLGSSINSQDFDGGPSISADGLSLYFVTDRDVVGGGDIWVAVRHSTSEPFGPPTSLGAAVNSSEDEGSPSISADGLELFFDRAPEGRIYVATRSSITAAFGKPQVVNLGRTGCCDGFPDVSADGRELYFCSDRAGGMGGDDIWVTSRPAAGSAFGAAVNLGPTVNAASNDCEASISRDGTTLFFASDRKGGRGGYDIWLSVRGSRSRPFGEPVNAGPQVNSGFSDERPDVTSDGTILYFMSDRRDGLGSFDLWRARRASAA